MGVQRQNYVKNQIEAVGQEIIERANEVATDLSNTCKIKIHSEIDADSNLTVEISKEYVIDMNKYYENHVSKNKEK